MNPKPKRRVDGPRPATGPRGGDAQATTEVRASPPVQPARRSGNAGLLLATGAFRSTQNMAQTTLALLGTSLGLNGAAIGALAAGANLLGVVMIVLVTAHIATSSAQRAVFVGLLFMTGSIACFLVSSSAMLVAGSVFLGLAGGLVLPSAATAVADRASSGADSSRTARGRALARLALVLSVSLAVGPVYESLVLSATDERLWSAYVAFLPVVLVGAVVARRRRWTTPSPVAPVADSFRDSMVHLGSLFRNRKWRLAVCGQTIYMVPFALVVVFASLLGKSMYHASASMTEMGIAVFFTVSFLCRAILTRWPAVGHRVQLFAAGIAATSGGIALLAAGGSVGLFVAALAVLGAPHGLCYPLALGLVSDSVPVDGLSRANAGLQAVSNTVNVVMPLLFGLVIDQFGDRAMLLCAAVPVMALAGLLWLLRDAG